MADVTLIINVVQTGGFIGLLIILAFPDLRKKFGFDGNKNYDPNILAEALRTALVDDNHSPILVKGRIVRICDDVNTLKQDVAIIKDLLRQKKGATLT